jgi:hypothetical protein
VFSQEAELNRLNTRWVLAKYITEVSLIRKNGLNGDFPSQEMG